MADIIQQLYDLQEWVVDKDRYERRMNFRSGQLVQPGPGRQGYQGNPRGERKPLNKKQLKLLKEYKKYSTGNIDVTDAKVKSKIRLGTVDEDTIKWMKDHDQWEYSDPRTRYNTLSKKWEKNVSETVDGKKINKWISQKTNETKPQFFKRIKEYSAGQISSSAQKQAKLTKQTQSYMDNWATDWLDNNLESYGVRDFDKMSKTFAKDWQSHLKKIDLPKGFLRDLSTQEGLPNLAGRGTGRGATRIPFTYEGFELYTGGDRLSDQFKKMFYKNKIRTTPGLKKDLKTYFDFITRDKRGMYNQPGGQTIKAYKDIVNKDVIYLLSPDAEIGGTPKYQLFNSFDKDFNNSYNSYSRKVHNSSQWRDNANLIEKKLGLKKNHIYNSMKKESKNLAKIFDVKQLPPELRYTLEHAQGIGAAAKSGNKEIMKRAVEDLIGTTIKQNQSLGWHGGGFEATRNALMREIVAGRNVKSNIASLNKLAKEAYTDFGLKGNMYSLKGGKLSSQPISKALTETDRFSSYFKQIGKTKEGAAALKKQAKTNKELKEFLKLAGDKARKIPPQYGVGMNAANVIDDALKSGKFKGLTNFLKGEGIFMVADYLNNISKGQSNEKAWAKAVEMGTLDAKGIISDELGADEKAILKHAQEQGASEQEVTAIRDYLNYMKKFETYQTAEKMLNYAKKNLAEGENVGDYMDTATSWEDVTNAAENLKLREKELGELQSTYLENTEDMELGMNMLDKYMKSLAAEEWNKTAGTWMDRGSRPHQGEGLIWGGVGALTRDIGALATGKMPTHLWDWIVPAQIDPWTKDEKQIRIMERPAVGTDYPEYNMAMEDMRMDLGYALPENFSRGGITGVRRPNAIPPKSGPMPQGGGLSYMYNRVKKLTE